jgi:hypothetical protein
MSRVIAAARPPVVFVMRAPAPSIDVEVAVAVEAPVFGTDDPCTFGPVRLFAMTPIGSHVRSGRCAIFGEDGGEHLARTATPPPPTRSDVGVWTTLFLARQCDERLP